MLQWHDKLLPVHLDQGYDMFYKYDTMHITIYSGDTKTVWAQFVVSVFGLNFFDKNKGKENAHFYAVRR